MRTLKEDASLDFGKEQVKHVCNCCGSLCCVFLRVVYFVIFFFFFTVFSDGAACSFSMINLWSVGPVCRNPVSNQLTF